MNLILNELLDENLVKRINEYVNRRDDDEKITLDARVTINVPVRLPVYKNGDYSGSNLYEDCLDCASEYLEGGVSLRSITAGILVHSLEIVKLPPNEPILANIDITMAFFNMSSDEWDSTPLSVRAKLRAYVLTKT